MLKLKINPVVAEDLKSIRDYIAEDVGATEISRIRLRKEAEDL